MSHRFWTPVLTALALLTANAVAVVATSQAAPAGNAVTSAPTPGAFVSVAPVRVLDTRIHLGGERTGQHGTVAVRVTGLGAVPASGVSAVMVNVTVTNPTAPGYITAYADGGVRPEASDVNFVKGQTVPNLVIAPVGANGRVDLYNGSTGTTQLVADISGYFVGGSVSAPGTLTSVAPTRLLDTRLALGGTVVPARGTLALQVLGRGPVPAGAVSAVVVNVTATAATAPGYVTAYAGGATRPEASNLNFVPHQAVPNLVIVPVGADGTVRLYNGSAGTVQLVADVQGYFLGGGTPTATGAYVPSAPTRLLDTRLAFGGTTPGAHGSVDLAVAGTLPVPATGAAAVILNTTVTRATTGGYLTVYGDGIARPQASNLNFVAKQTVPNLVASQLGTGGKIQLYSSATGPIDLVADVEGYFIAAPGAIGGTITAAADAAPLGNVSVTAFLGTAVAGTATTAADGTYTIAGLVPSTHSYIVCFDARAATGGTSTTGYGDQCFDATAWNGIGQPSFATPILVHSGLTTTANAQLGVGAAVGGTVTAVSSGHPLTGVVVKVLTSDGHALASATTASDGTYQVSGLPSSSGGYTVCFAGSAGTDGTTATGYLSKCYQNVNWDGSATIPSGITPVTTTTGAVSTGIDAALVQGAAIAGTVTAATTGVALSDVGVTVYNGTGHVLGHGSTAADGTYRVTGLASAADYVCFTGSTGVGGTITTGYQNRCRSDVSWNGVSAPPTGSGTVSVTAGSVTPGVDAVLPPGGEVQGGVTSAPVTPAHIQSRSRALAAAGSGVSGVILEAFDADGNLAGLIVTGSGGSFALKGIPPSSVGYTLCVDVPSSVPGTSAGGYSDQCYDNIDWDGSPPLPAGTTPLIIQAGAAQAINLVLSSG